MIAAIQTDDSSLWRGLAAELANETGISDVRLMPPEDQRRGVEALVGFSMSAEQLKTWPDLRAIAAPMAGLNRFDLAALAARRIAVAPSHANGPYVAERALALMFGVQGRLVQWHQDFARGHWHGFAGGEPVSESWQSIRGENVAILGTGSIGIALARLLAPFDVNCVGYRRRADSDDLPAGLFQRVESDLRRAVAGAAAVVVTLPLTQRTRGLIDREALEAMRGALLINVGRGAIIDEEALLAALDDGTLAGAAIDTWWRYPGADGAVDAETLRFAGRPNVLLSPHVGGYTQKATEASAREAIAAIAEFARTELLPGAADAEQGY